MCGAPHTAAEVSVCSKANDLSCSLFQFAEALYWHSHYLLCFGIFFSGRALPRNGDMHAHNFEPSPVAVLPIKLWGHEKRGTQTGDCSLPRKSLCKRTHQVRFSAQVRKHACGNPTGVSVTWLGTSSGSPTLNRNNSGILLRSGTGTDESLMLVDAGIHLFPNLHFWKLTKYTCFCCAEMHTQLFAHKQCHNCTRFQTYYVRQCLIT